MSLLARPYLFWLAAPLILVLGVAAGIGSASAEQPTQALPPSPPPRTGGESTAPRPQPSIVAGQVVLIDMPSRTLIVERRDGKLVNVLLKNNTVIKVGMNRVRPRDINLGDKIVVVGRPRPKLGVDATIITVAPRRDVSTVPK